MVNFCYEVMCQACREILLNIRDVNVNHKSVARPRGAWGFELPLSSTATHGINTKLAKKYREYPLYCHIAIDQSCMRVGSTRGSGRVGPGRAGSDNLQI